MCSVLTQLQDIKISAVTLSGTKMFNKKIAECDLKWIYPECPSAPYIWEFGSNIAYVTYKSV